MNLEKNAFMPKYVNYISTRPLLFVSPSERISAIVLFSNCAVNLPDDRQRHSGGMGSTHNAFSPNLTKKILANFNLMKRCGLLYRIIRAKSIQGGYSPVRTNN